MTTLLNADNGDEEGRLEDSTDAIYWLQLVYLIIILVYHSRRQGSASLRNINNIIIERGTDVIVVGCFWFIVTHML